MDCFGSNKEFDFSSVRRSFFCCFIWAAMIFQTLVFKQRSLIVIFRCCVWAAIEFQALFLKLRETFVVSTFIPPSSEAIVATSLEIDAWLFEWEYLSRPDLPRKWKHSNIVDNFNFLDFLSFVKDFRCVNLPRKVFLGSKWLLWIFVDCFLFLHLVSTRILLRDESNLGLINCFIVWYMWLISEQ